MQFGLDWHKPISSTLFNSLSFFTSVLRICLKVSQFQTLRLSWQRSILLLKFLTGYKPNELAQKSLTRSSQDLSFSYIGSKWKGWPLRYNLFCFEFEMKIIGLWSKWKTSRWCIQEERNLSIQSTNATPRSSLTKTLWLPGCQLHHEKG